MEKTNRLEPSYTIINSKPNLEIQNNINNNHLDRLVKKSYTNKYNGNLLQDQNLENKLQRMNIFEIKNFHNRINKISGDNCQIIDEDSPREYNTII